MSKIERIYSNIGARIRVLRISAGYDKTHVADIVGISRSHVGMIEEGQRRFALHYIERFADLFGLTVEDFLKGVWL